MSHLPFLLLFIVFWSSSFLSIMVVSVACQFTESRITWQTSLCASVGIITIVTTGKPIFPISRCSRLLCSHSGRGDPGLDTVERCVMHWGWIHCSLFSNCECHDQLLWAPTTVTSTGWTVPWIDFYSLKLLLLQQQERNWHEVLLLSCILKTIV